MHNFVKNSWSVFSNFNLALHCNEQHCKEDPGMNDEGSDRVGCVCIRSPHQVRSQIFQSWRGTKRYMNHMIGKWRLPAQRYGIVWRGVVRYSAVWYDTVQCGTILCGTVRARLCTARYVIKDEIYGMPGVWIIQNQGRMNCWKTGTQWFFG